MSGERVARAPMVLETAARLLYNKIGRQLMVDQGVKELDTWLLAQLAKDLIMAERLEAEIGEEGEVHTTDSGYPVPNPKCALQAKALDRVFRAESALGMTPAGRKAIKGFGDISKKQAANAKRRFAKFQVG